MNAAKCGHGSAPPNHQTGATFAIIPAPDITNMIVYTFTPGGATRDKSHVVSATRASVTVTDGLLATNALDQHMYRGCTNYAVVPDKNREKNSQCDHNESLYLKGLKSVVRL